MGMSENLSTMEEALREKGVDPTKLGVVHYGQEAVIGEIDISGGDVVKVRNPKRFLRVQRMEQSGNLRVEFAIIDFDLINEGVIAIKPQVVYGLKDIDEAGCARLYGMYLGYFEQRRIASAAKSGIVLPPNGGSVSPIGR